MRRDQLEHAIRTACQITDSTEVIVVGSQAILGTYPEYELPTLATRSAEIDILPLTDDHNRTIELADLIVAVAGELSPFQQTHGFSIDGVDLTTSALPDGWKTRLVKVQNENTAPPSGQPQYIGWCLDKEDLCVAKLCAFREKDRNFVDALIEAHLVEPAVIDDRLVTVPPRYSSSVQRARPWLAYRIAASGTS
ncbi:DUF6036 family nucleotidyltransferase [Mycobacterium intracellulare]|uniref:DUF6036 family nucleotidyltransferase n=1 Tax=Mycobacterium intracellulare TaxID=1767 RepID=A0AAE4UB41_MYCIT|nr:DUF6036 family nucleotidyltransferase [Mycobacterium intracellulare]MDV6979103.1 DUF6036 family nucleotidyltransferase [Mycobacterium intracellulare]MDV6984511.1 DUF6036 family nucleotidyltransferase [Mycobacterium intracellulare]MDV7014591.1 DUF6036 family nucleotidyltransferase [Mycobacterium intracellulare]MDV7029507.1 DUF6036 family nucleotidyltransferase [Mycobacterium intracellulare]